MSTSILAPMATGAVPSNTVAMAPPPTSSGTIRRSSLKRTEGAVPKPQHHRSRKRLSWSVIEPPATKDQQAATSGESFFELKKSTDREKQAANSTTAGSQSDLAKKPTATPAKPKPARPSVQRKAMLRSISFAHGARNVIAASGVIDSSGGGGGGGATAEEAILVNCDQHEHRPVKRVKSEPTIVALGDEETVGGTTAATFPPSQVGDTVGFFIDPDDDDEAAIEAAAREIAEDSSQDTAASSATPTQHNMEQMQQPKLYQPAFRTPPHPSTCDPNMSPDSFVKALVHAYLGYTPHTLPCLGLPESYFPGINEEHMMCYGVQVVAAVRENNLPMVQALHAAGHPLACCNRFGESLMHMACRRGYTQVFHFLLNEAGVDVRIRDDCGRSPLHDACWNRDPQYEIVDALLQKDPALLLIADKRGHTPFAYARREHWGVWRQFLSDRVQYIVRGLDQIEQRQIFGGEK